MGGSRGDWEEGLGRLPRGREEAVGGGTINSQEAGRPSPGGGGGEAESLQGALEAPDMAVSLEAGEEDVQEPEA